MSQGDLQAPGLEEREHPGSGPQSPRLLPQAPGSQVSTSMSVCSLWCTPGCDRGSVKCE